MVYMYNFIGKSSASVHPFRYILKTREIRFQIFCVGEEIVSVSVAEHDLGFFLEYTYVFVYVCTWVYNGVYVYIE